MNIGNLPLVVLCKRDEAEGCVWREARVERVRVFRPSREKRIRKSKYPGAYKLLLASLNPHSSRQQVETAWRSAVIGNKKMFNSVAPGGWETEWTAQYSKPSMLKFLPQLYNSRMGAPMLAIYQPKRGPAHPALLCRDAEAAWLVLWLFSKVGWCVSCGKQFTPGREGQAHCSQDCPAWVRERMRAYYARKTAKNKRRAR